MCGIVGFANWSSVTNQTTKKWFQSALFVDTLRGSDGTGIAVLPQAPFNQYSTQKGLGMYKKALAAPDFLQLHRVDKLMGEVAQARFALGHNRAATQGDKTKDDNAHPFQVGHITMVHNGTLVTRNGLQTADAVDSRAIAHELADDAFVTAEDYATLMSKLDGAFTLIWYNANTNKIYFARNDQRPLVMGSGNNGDTLFFASEQWMITQLLARYSDNLLDIDEKNYYKTWSMKTNVVYEYDADIAPEQIAEGDAAIPFESYVPKTVTYTTKTHSGSVTGSGKGTIVDGGTSLVLPFTPAGSPVKVGDHFYAEKWNYNPNANQKRGIISGVSSDFPNVGFSAGNISSRKAAKLEKDLKEWNDWLDNPENGLADDALREVLLCGTVTQVTMLKSKKDFIVQLKPSSLEVDCIETPVIDVLEGDETEKKSSPTWGDQVTQGAYRLPTGGYGSYQEWFGYIKDGCTYCKQAFIAREHEEIVWYSFQSGTISQFEPVCMDCAKHALN